MDNSEIAYLSYQSKHYIALLNFLKSVEGDFCPPLSARKDLKDYLNADLTTNSETILAIVANDIVGFVNLQFNEPKPGKCYINTIAVHQHFRMHGIGSQLINKVFEIAKTKSFAAITTRTWSTNVSGLAMYAHSGFKTDYIVNNARGNKIDSIYLIKELA